MLRQMKRVVVTGFGMVSPLGIDSKSSWQNLLQGASGIVNIKDLPECQNDSFPEGYIAPIHKSFDKKKWRIPVNIYSIFNSKFNKILYKLVYPNSYEFLPILSNRRSFTEF